MLNTVLQKIDASRTQSLEGLKAFLHIPSVSTKPEHAPDMRRCAQFVVQQLADCGFVAQIHDTPGHPIVVAKNEHRRDRPTVLIYGHYDVQPPEPLDQWTSPPFEPTVRKDENGFDAIYARGAVDDKGQVWCHIQALRAWKQGGNLPLNITLLIEGEEEIGSINLEQFIESHKNELKADIALVSDTNQFARNVPAITYGLRGLVYTEVTLTGPSHDLHSGLYGGTLQNPANALCALLATLHNPDGSVNIPGFYDDVRKLTPHERDIWSKLPFSDEAHRKEMGVPELFGEAGFSTLERKWARPTLDINGLTSGYQGPGAKTIIPAKASAKVSMRLVPDQDPRKIESLFREALELRLAARYTLKDGAQLLHDAERAVGEALRKQLKVEDSEDFTVTFDRTSPQFNVTRGGKTVPLSQFGRAAAQTAKQVMIEVALALPSQGRDASPVTLEIHVHSGAHPSLLPIDNPATQLAARAVKTGFGIDPVFMREGGTVPVGTLFKAALGIDTLFIGFGLSDDRVHSPNEKFDLDALHKGTRTAAALYAELANLKPQ